MPCSLAIKTAKRAMELVLRPVKSKRSLMSYVLLVGIQGSVAVCPGLSKGTNQTQIKVERISRRPSLEPYRRPHASLDNLRLAGSREYGEA